MRDRLHRFWIRLLEWRRPDVVADDAAEEVESHLAFLVDAHLQRGLSPEEARRQALLDLGGLDQARALLRDARGFRVVDAIRADIRLAFRQLQRTPGFTIAAILTLALGIGANTAIFSVVDAVMLRPLPYAEPDRVVALWEVVSEGLSAPGVAAQAGPPQRVAVAPANLMDYRSRVTSLASLAAYSAIGLNATEGGRPERLIGETVTTNYFSTLGALPARGRTFIDEEGSVGNDKVAIISHGLWQRRFGGAENVVGAQLTLNDAPHEVVGVMPPDFVALTQPGQTEPVSVWTPMVFEADSLANRNEHLVDVVGRLAPGVSIEAARAELTAMSDALGREFPEASGTQAQVALLRADQVTDVRTLLMVLLGAVGLVLLVACVNVAGLLLVRAVGRRRELAVRCALGASRARVILEQVVQSLVLAIGGTVVGLLLSVVVIRILVAEAPASMPHIQSAGLSGRVLVFTALAALVTSLLFGAWPALQAAKVDPIDALKHGERSVSAGWVVRRRNVLLVAEVALSAVLLTGAVLMLRSLRAIDDVDLGFDPTGVLAASVQLPASRYPTPEARLQFFLALEARLQQVPGVTSVTFGNRLPLRGDWISGMLLDGGTTFQQAGFQAVSPTYLSTFGIRLVHGRAITDEDRVGSTPVALINEQLARTFFADANPVGHVIRRAPTAPAITIVGVVGDVRRGGRLDETGTHAAAVMPQVYLPAAQTMLYPLPLREVALRTTPDVTGVGEQIRAAVIALDPDQPVTAVRTLEQSLGLRSAEKRFQASLFILFAAVGFGLAVVGIYGVVAYGVSQRSAELALRMALGATTTGLVIDIVRRTTLLVASGVVVGLGVALAASRYVTSLLFEIAPTDPLTYALTAAGLLLAGAAAGTVAGRRATRVDPITALR
jgi:putative ABC transport system permease protein